MVTNGRISGSGNGGSSNPVAGDNANFKDQRKKIQELKNDPNVKLLPNIPNTLHVQKPGTHDCVPRAFAFAMELKGHNFDAKYEELKSKAIAGGCDLDEVGMSDDNIKDLFKTEKTGIEFEVIKPENHKPSYISNLIDNGFSVVAGVPGSPEGHEVLIIGYNVNDPGIVYVAAGNEEGSANYCRLAQLCNKDMYLIK